MTMTIWNPVIAAKHRRRVTDEKSLTFFGLAGFEFWDTGGGCTAFGRRIDAQHLSLDAEIIVTVDDDARHPNDDEKRVRVTLADNQDQEIDQEVAESWKSSIDIANAMIDAYLASREPRPYQR
jgi:hypothetical protein